MSPAVLSVAPASRTRTWTSCKIVSSLPISPARTCTDAAAQARAALRRYRVSLRPQPDPNGGTPAAAEQPLLPRRLTVRLPLPTPDVSKKGDSVQNYDQADWPGGIQQRFRRLRPLIEEHLLAGYEPQFLGMLESPADGIGVWQAAGGDTTVVAQVGNQNFAPFARLCAGDFGSRVQEPSHTLLVVNPTWTKSSDIGQLWDRKLKQQAASLIDDPSAWLPLYYLWDVRTAKGATGMLFRSWPHDWQLYHTTSHQEEPAVAFDEPPILTSCAEPTREQQIEALNAALQREKAAQQAAKKQR